LDTDSNDETEMNEVQLLSATKIVTPNRMGTHFKKLSPAKFGCTPLFGMKLNQPMTNKPQTSAAMAFCFESVIGTNCST
jgi:hypothetical protein